MDEEQIVDVLKRARRPLDSLSQVAIIDDWKFEQELNVWFLHFSISIVYKTKLFPQKSQWYIIVKSEYPEGKIKVHPDVKNSITGTLYHQANNSRVEKNGLWRTGALCLEVNTLADFQPEPYSIDERLLYHVKRAINWLEAAAKGILVSDNEPFELPAFTLSNIPYMFAFSEDAVTYRQWGNTDCQYGIAELDVYQRNPFIYYVKFFNSLQQQTEHCTQWGTYLSKNFISPLIKAPWILLKQPPVLHEWQASATLGDLIESCNEQHINLIPILQELVSQIRDGKHHFLLLGFPIPKVFGGLPEIIFWQALWLPVVSCGKHIANGFRNNELGWWMNDRQKILTKNTQLEWILSENWNQREISRRGKMNDLLQKKRILLLGAGCIGASIGEMLVRAGIYDLTIMDVDRFEVGNLSRHTLSLNDIGKPKESSLCNHLNLLSPHANVEVVNNKRTNFDEFKTNIDLEKYDMIIDCTGENDILKFFQKTKFERQHMIVSVSVGLGAKRLYVTLMNGISFNFDGFYVLIDPYIQKEKALYDDYDLPRNGIGCWHPTFPGRSDDIWLAAATSVKIIEKYIINSSTKTLSLIYEQRFNNGIYEGYMIVDKKENE